MKTIYALLITACLSVIAYGQTPPTANFTGTPTTVCLGQAVTFNSTSTPGTAAITSYSYDFGDGNSAVTANATHVYSAPGTYTVILTVQASNGQADAEVKANYIVVNPTPTSNFTASTNGCSLPVGVTFNNTSSGGVSYSWNFGNSQTSTAQNPPTQNYTTAGTYNVTLITTNSFGCKDTLIQPIVVSNFQAGITAPATACQNTPVTIQDASTIGANNWSWSFPGASPGNSTSQNNSVTYSAPGTYTISLTSQNTGSGCSGNATQQITILPTPVPSFTNTPTTGCAPLPVTFTNTSGAGTFVWDFGDGSPTFSGQTPPAHTYTTNGSYTVTLTMTNANGCVGTFSTVAVNMVAPIANFTSDVVDGCDPLSVQFTDASNGNGQTINSWTWIFGDGSPNFSGQNPPVHVYNLGVYDVTLIVSTTQGCIDTVSIDEYIEVGHIDLVDFDIDATPECAKTNIDFTNQSVILAPHDPADVTYYWDFGDGGSSTVENPGYSYPNDTGYFDVTLIVTWRGCKDTLVMTDAVYIKAPISIFQPTQTLYCNPASFPVNVAVTDNSIIGKLSDDCSMIWRWGDGQTTNFDDPDFDDADKGSTSHNYTAYGSYTIKQVIYNATTGCSDSTTQTVHISQTIAGITPPLNDSVCVGSTFALDDNSTSTHPFGTYSWNMGNGQTVSGSNPSYAYPSFGTFTITLTATNSVGCADNETFTPMIALALPQAAITADDAVGCAPHLVTFTNNSSTQNNGVPLESFVFSFSDNNTTQNTTSVGTTVQHTFNTEGSFTVSLVATDEFGCVSAPANANITITKPVANFTVDAVVCELENFVASNTSSGVAPMTYQWSIDGTQVSTSQDYPSSHNEPSSNSVSSWVHNYQLITTDANGCKDTLVQQVTVSTPVAIIDYVLDGAATNANGDFLCPPVFATFTDESLTLGNITGHSWIFGDGKTSVLTNPSNTYVFPGTYSVTLNITDEYGCTSDTTLVDYLTIFGPTATPDWVQDPSVCGQLVDFTIGDTSNVTQIVWDMGDGVTLNDSTDFTYGYLDVTTYNPSVTVYDDNGCQVLYPLDPITIPDNGLNAQFTISPNPSDLGDAVVFDDISTANSTIVSWTWDLVNIDPFTLNNGSSVSSTYVSPGDMVITLVIQDNNGCFDSYEGILHVNGDFSMPNVITADGDGINDVFEFKYPIFEKFDILIVDRWGSVVQDQKNMTGKVFWDGRNNGEELVNDGVYHYILDAVLTDGTPLHKDGFLHVYAKR